MKSLKKITCFILGHRYIYKAIEVDPKKPTQYRGITVTNYELICEHCGQKFTPEYETK